MYPGREPLLALLAKGHVPRHVVWLCIINFITRQPRLNAIVTSTGYPRCTAYIKSQMRALSRAELAIDMGVCTTREFSSSRL